MRLSESLERPEQLRSPFRWNRDTLRHTVELLGFVGNQRAAEVLRRFVSDPQLADEAVRAIRAIEARS